MIHLILKQLTPDLLKPPYKYNPDNPTQGFCYVASEALYYWLLLEKTEKDFRPMSGRDDNGVVHWWLQNAKKQRLDPTSDQYLRQGLIPPYERGQHRGFLTAHPSRRCLILLSRLGLKL